MTPEEFLKIVVTMRLYLMPPAAGAPSTWFICNDDRSAYGFGTSPVAAAKDLVARREQDLSFLE